MKKPVVNRLTALVANPRCLCVDFLGLMRHVLRFGLELGLQVCLLHSAHFFSPQFPSLPHLIFFVPPRSSSFPFPSAYPLPPFLSILLARPLHKVSPPSSPSSCLSLSLSVGLHIDLELFLSCTFVSLVTELSGALGHSSNAFALAQSSCQNSFPFDMAALISGVASGAGWRPSRLGAAAAVAQRSSKQVWPPQQP